MLFFIFIGICQYYNLFY